MADKCTPVHSSWLTHIGTRGGKFFACFRNGFCCIYPNTNESYYDVAMGYASKGHFLHEWLYKILPYTPIRNPCPDILGVTVGCCPNALPQLLHATFSGSADGSCDVSVPLTWSAGGLNYNNAAAAIGSCVLAVEFVCDISNQFELLVGPAGGLPDSVQCQPLSVQYTLTPGQQAALAGCCSDAGPTTCVVTT